MIRRHATLALARISDTASPSRIVAALPEALRARVSRTPKNGTFHAEDPSSQMFRRIRTRLTLWYSGALAAMLIVGSLLLYFAVQHALLAPVPGYLNESAQTISTSWAREISEHGPIQCDGYSPSGIP